MTYDDKPSYALVGGVVGTGYFSLAADLADARGTVLAIDGPAALAWEAFTDRLGGALDELGLRPRWVDSRGFLASWAEIQRRTASGVLDEDPVFARVYDGSLRELFDDLPQRIDSANADIVIVFGPGSALIGHDSLWYADVPKRHATAAVRAGQAANLGQPEGDRSSERRMQFIDWPVLDRHRDGLVAGLDRFVDVTDVARPRSVDGEVLRRTLHTLAGMPFRPRPQFAPGAWGGQWMRRALGVGPDHAPNLAWSFELVAPENGVLLGDRELVEVPFSLLVAVETERLVGAAIAARFGSSFPIRFDYLDTVDGGDLSVHCHPQPESMWDVFGWPYPQHETYYVMVASPSSTVFLGVRDDVDMEAFRRDADRAAQHGEAFDVEKYVNVVPAEQHRLYAIPAGTPHASGRGNVVLEVSSTPYLYSLRFYDWLRRDLSGLLRPVHPELAFANVRAGQSRTPLDQLVREPDVQRSEPGCIELLLEDLDELFFQVRRLDFDDECTDDTDGRFHLLNLVEGDEVDVESPAGSHRLSYAETILIPAAVGPYRLRRVSGPPCKVVKALVTP